MTAPGHTLSSTYRLQLHHGFGFADAAAAADHVRALGVSHLYCSPILQAAPGSMHGYDVVDHSRANDELGGEPGREYLHHRLVDLGLGLVVDIVPNHMSVAVPPLNRWWWDVLAFGPQSRFAGCFDIDWSRGKLLLPVLGDAPGEADKIELVDGELSYYDKRFPVAPGTGDGTAAVIHARQHYELVSWRRANRELNYRRFFDITDLAAIRVERPEVFADSHREVLRWVSAREVDGLRIDHPDGLADPGGYLERLREAAPGCWVVVEKILEPGEQLPESWACAGTTGYDALRHVGGLFVDPAAESPLTDLYAELTGEPTDFLELAYELKRRAADNALAAEVHRLAALRPEIDDGADAVAELMAAFPVYRSYLPGWGDGYLEEALRAADRRRPGLEGSLDRVAAAVREAGTEFSVRFQQTSGMVMAKGVEDTAFYRYNRFIALNEVGGDPTEFGVTPSGFHEACATRQERWPLAMTTLSTHDTKRSEDVRARLAVLAELPAEWGAAVRGWMARRPAPDPNIGYLFWQTLVGAWPLSRDRAYGYLEKASREAKQHTSWTDRNDSYDVALRDFVDAVYADDELLAGVGEFVGRIAAYGWSNALGQKLLQLTMPGVPDIYQGTELWDLSLVDPDNRRPVDFALRRSMLMDLHQPPGIDDSGAAKLWLVSRALRCRQDSPRDFAGSYRPVLAAGAAADHAVGFWRGAGVVALVTRLPFRLNAAGGWGDTSVELPEGAWTDALTGQGHHGRVRCADLFARLPVALLVRG